MHVKRLLRRVRHLFVRHVRNMQQGARRLPPPARLTVFMGLMQTDGKIDWTDVGGDITILPDPSTPSGFIVTSDVDLTHNDGFVVRPHVALPLPPNGSDPTRN